MKGSKNRRGGSHHHFVVGGLVPSQGLVTAAVAAIAAAAALRLSAAAFLALASCLGGLFLRCLRERCSKSCIACGTQVDFECSFDERLA
jgi:hypothetical protein